MIKGNELNHHHEKHYIKQYLLFNRLSSWLMNAVYSLYNNKIKTYIFVATTGRSGSSSLNKIFDNVDDVASFHEPYPIMLNPIKFNCKKNIYFKKLFKSKKRIYIKKECKDKEIYFESNHMFIKNFSDEIVTEFGNKVKVIYLVREPILVAKSFLAINSIPGKTETGITYLLTPEHEDNLINLSGVTLPENEVECDFCLCLWYWFEIQARALAFHQQNPQIQFVTIRTEDLNDRIKISLLFGKLGLNIDSTILDKVVGIKENSKVSEKNKFEKNSISESKMYELYDSIKKKLELVNGSDRIIEYKDIDAL